MSSTSPVLRVQDVAAGYLPEVDILCGVDLVVGEDELVTVVGPNGAGKSTLLKAVAGLLAPRTGSVTFLGEVISGLRPFEIARRGIGYVPQRANVFAGMSVGENLELSVMDAPKAEREERRAAMHDLFPRLGSRPGQIAGTLSGGERQMLAMARVLMANPKLLLLDEPSAGLSPLLVEQVLEKIRAINRSGVPVLLVEQNARRALAMSHRGYVLDLGRNRFEDNGPALLADRKVVDLYLGGVDEQDPWKAPTP